MEKVIRVLGTANKYLCATFISIAVIVVFANTVMRYWFSSGIIMGEELVRYLFVWATFLAVISGYYERRHIAVTLLSDRLSPRTGVIFAFIMNFAALYALGILFQGSIMYFNETTTMGQVTGVPYKAIVAAALLGSAACLCIVLADMYKQFRLILSGKIPATTPKPGNE